jgi:hypothetical protein
VAFRYVFCDLITGTEKAVLPMTGVGFDEKVSGVGQLTGVVPTGDPKIRALDPWAAAERRRTALYVELDGIVVWSGIVWGVDQADDVAGLAITAGTWESWLHTAYLISDQSFVGMQLGAPSTFAGLVAAVQSQQVAADVRLSVSGVGYPWDIGQGGDGTGEARVGGKVYARTDLKSLAELLEGWVGDWSIPIEFRIDGQRTPGAARPYSQTLYIAEGSISANRVELNYPRNLLKFKNSFDGSGEANQVIGSAKGPGGVALWSRVSADQVGSDEFAAGYPVTTETFSVGGNDVTQASLDRNVTQRLYDRLVQGQTIGNLQTRVSDPPLTSYRVGDTANIEITHASFREWPKSVEFPGFRIVSRKVSVGDGNSPSSVSLSVVPPADRLPTSIALPALLRDLMGRVTTLETP